MHGADIAAGTIASYAVFRPRTSTNGAYRYGASLAPRLEFWRFGTKVVEAPRPTALTRRVTAREDLSIVETERYGRSWRTIAGMLDPPPDAVPPAVDMALHSVDGTP